MSSGENKYNKNESHELREQSGFSKKSKLKKALFTGIHGKPKLKRDEKIRYLGEFRERVIRALTLSQIHEEGTYEEILAAIRHPKAKKLKISREADLQAAKEYINLAKEEDLSFTTVDSPEHKGPIGLVVVSDEAVNIEEIMVKPRREKLKNKGIPEDLIEAVGEKICDDCMDTLEEKAPEEVDNYKKLGILDKILGERCEACQE